MFARKKMKTTLLFLNYPEESELYRWIVPFCCLPEFPAIRQSDICGAGYGIYSKLKFVKICYLIHVKEFYVTQKLLFFGVKQCSDFWKVKNWTNYGITKLICISCVPLLKSDALLKMLIKASLMQFHGQYVEKCQNIGLINFFNRVSVLIYTF